MQHIILTNILKTAVIPAAVSILLAACGASRGRIDEVNAELESLREVRSHAEETWDGLYDDSLFWRVTDAGQRFDALAQTDLSALTDAQIDTELLPAIRELADTYDKLQEKLDEIAETEKELYPELEDNEALSFHILNGSGEDYTSLTWSQGAKIASRDLLTIPVPFSDGQTLAGMTVPVVMEKSSQMLRLVTETQDGETRSYDVGRISSFDVDSLYYLVLLPGETISLTDDPAVYSGQEESEGEEAGDQVDEEAPEDAAEVEGDGE